MIMNSNQKLDDLKIPIVDLPRQPGATQTHEFTVELPNDLSVYDVQVSNDNPINVNVVLTSVSEGILVDLYTQTKVKSQCYRCLKEVENSYDISSQELYFYPGMRQKAIDEGDEQAEEMFEIENENIDLGTLLRDCIVLELPMRMLCDQDCEGLCPHCAKPYSELEENHTHEIIDNRWQGLMELAEKLKEGKDD